MSGLSCSNDMTSGPPSDEVLISTRGKAVLPTQGPDISVWDDTFMVLEGTGKQA